ncbi:MAG: thrombospondin type-1 domain-containing protein [Patescibacteria group bacterium]
MPTYTYSWQTGNYGSCSATCGGGTQTRSVVCVMDQGGSVVADSYCTGPKPTDSISCNPDPCNNVPVVSHQYQLFDADVSGGGTSCQMSGWNDSLGC